VVTDHEFSAPDLRLTPTVVSVGLISPPPAHAHPKQDRSAISSQRFCFKRLSDDIRVFVFVKAAIIDKISALSL